MRLYIVCTNLKSALIARYRCFDYAQHDRPVMFNETRTEFAFPESSITLQSQPSDTMLQTRSFFGYYYFYATA
jgi:hypothetical protein